MNKSKFLKKSLAMVLAVMLVVAMIPLGASAAVWTNDGVVVSVTSTLNDAALEGSGKTFSDPLPYYVTNPETLTIAFDRSAGVTSVGYEIDGGNTSTVNINSNAAEISGITYPSVLTFQAYGEDEETVGSQYTVTLTKAAPSADTSLKSATLTTSDNNEVEGIISGKTITFTIPWDDDANQDTSTVSASLNYPVNGNDPQTSTVTGLVDDGTLPIVSQQGSATTYTVVTKEAELLKTLTVGGVTAVLDNDEDSDTYGEYFVTLPEDTDFSEEQAVTFTTATGIKIASQTWGAQNATAAAVKTGDEVTVADGGVYELKFTSALDNATTKTYTVNVSAAKNNDASISGFTATVTDDYGTEWTETGVVSGDKLTVELPYGFDLDSVDLAFTTATSAKVTVNGNETFTGIDLNSAATVEVVAADGETVKYYQLTATVAANPYGDPKITAAKLTIGDDEYTGTINETASTITFTVPYATTENDVKNGNFTWAKTQATFIDEIDWDDEDIFEGTNLVTVVSVSSDWKTYKIVLNKQPAKTGKTLSALSFTSATTEDDVTADNTYTAAVSADKVTVTLPYSYQTTLPALAAQFTLPEGAALYVNDTTTNTNLGTNALVTGFNDDGNPNASISNLTQIVKLVVADETAALALREATAAVTIAQLSKDATYKTHVTVYDLEIKYAPAEKGHTLTAFSADDGNVTSKISATAIEITVPASYAEYDVVFYADYTASKLATVTAGTVELPAAIADLSTESGSESAGALKYDSTSEVLQVYDGSDWTTVTKITVENEAETDSTDYDVTVKVAPYRTEALLKSLTVNNVKGVINHTAKTVTVTLPFNADLTAVTVAYTASDMAYTFDDLGTPETIDDVDYYDVSEGFKVQVVAEDVNTSNVYNVTVTTATQFSDVSENAWYHDNVYAAAAAGIISGYPDGTFKPTNSITRQDFAVMLANMLGADVSGYTTTPFSDVSSNYATGAIAYCAENGYMTGDGNGKFRPTDNITRQEAASTMARALNLTGTSSEKFTDDAKIASWAKTAVYACKAAGVFSGDKGTGNFRPTDKITRAEAATIMVQAAK